MRCLLRSSTRVLSGLAFALLAAGLLALPSWAGEGPLTEEDVVRLLVGGTPTDEIVETIHASETSFDLSDEMLEELRIAGLPADVIRAMVERQAELTPSPEPVPATDDPAPGEPVPTLRVRLSVQRSSREDGGTPVVRLRDEISTAVHERLRLREPAPVFTDLALVLICRTPDHVPDQWRSRTPLGRDFVGTPRHELLAFHSGADHRKHGTLRQFASRLGTSPGARDSVPDSGILELAVPTVIFAAPEAGVSHDLTLGLAARAEGRYYLLAGGDADEVQVPPEGIEIEVEIDSGRQGKLGDLEVRWKVKEDASGESTPAP